jgi:cysteine-rich repeat protein
MPSHLRFLSLLFAAFLLATVGPPRLSNAAVTITVLNLDGPSEGFNDPTPVAPVGGNSGTTLGAQRLIAFEYATDLWAAVLTSDVEIRVAAEFNPLPCNAQEVVLGQAGSESVLADFDGAPEAATWYPDALADKLAGLDLSPLGADIGAEFNSTFGTTCAFPDGWYYGLDASPPGFDVDFVTTVLHELAHGLGFFTLVTSSGGRFLGDNDVFMLSLEDHSEGLLWPEMTNGERRDSSRDTGDLHWVGPEVVAASGFLTSGVDPGTGHVEMYAPSSYEYGSSVSHFSDALFPNDLMEPFDTGATHDVGLTLELLSDLGWTFDCGNGIVNGGEECDDGNTLDEDGCSATCQIEVPEPQDKGQQKCINALNKNFAKVAKAQGKDVIKCIKDYAKGKSLAPATSLEGCLTADRKGKVAKAAGRTDSDEITRCTATAPDFGVTDAVTVNAAAIQKELDLIHEVFGSDLDLAILPQAGANEDASQCQQAISRTVQKCQDTTIGEFNRCKKTGLKDQTIQSDVDLQSCMGLDPKGKIAKSCDPITGRIQRDLGTRCSDTDLSDAFPGCDTDDPAALATCLDRIVACQACLALNTADDLDQDCDAFDDNDPNNQSCP